MEFLNNVQPLKFLGLHYLNNTHKHDSLVDRVLLSAISMQSEATPSAGYYAVRAGRKPGIYTDPEEMYPQIYQFPGAQCKRFTCLQDAEEYMNEDEVSFLQTPYRTGFFHGQVPKY